MNLVRSLGEVLKVVHLKSPTPQDVNELRKFVRAVNKKVGVRQHKTVSLTTVDINPPLDLDEGGGEQFIKIAQWLIEHDWVQWPEGNTEYLRSQQKHAKTYDAFYALGNLCKKGDAKQENSMNAVTLQKLEEIRQTLEQSMNEADRTELYADLYPGIEAGEAQKIRNWVQDAKSALYGIQNMMHKTLRPKLGMRVTGVINDLERFETALKLGRKK